MPKEFCEPDVTVSIGGVPEALENATLNQPTVQANAREMLLRVEGVATYYVRDGARIVVSPSDQPDEPLIQVYLLGTCFGALLQQRGVLPLHGSCICKDGLGLLITGASGAGKSTLATAFLARGWKLVSDDVTPVTFRGGVCRACPSYPGQKLWEDALEIHQGAVSRMRGVAWEDGGRRKFTLDASDLFVDEEVILTHVAVLALADGALDAREIVGFSKVDALMKNTYRPGLIADMERKRAQFQRCVDIAGAVQLFYVVRPQGDRTEEEIAERIGRMMSEGPQR